MTPSVLCRASRFLSSAGLASFVLCSACGGSSSPAAPSVFTIHAQGVLAIPQTHLVDLDQGVLTPPMSDVDLWFEAENWTRRYLTAVNGARMAVVGTDAPGRIGCAAATMQPGRVSIGTLTVGVYACVQTNLGRYAQVRIEQMPGPEPAAGEPMPSVSISFTTYE